MKIEENENEIKKNEIKEKIDVSSFQFDRDFFLSTLSFFWAKFQVTNETRYLNSQNLRL